MALTDPSDTRSTQAAGLTAPQPVSVFEPQLVREIAQAIVDRHPFTDEDAWRVAAAYLAFLDGQEST